MDKSWVIDTCRFGWPLDGDSLLRDGDRTVDNSFLFLGEKKTKKES